MNIFNWIITFSTFSKKFSKRLEYNHQNMDILIQNHNLLHFHGVQNILNPI